jgi:uncharacterized GH25 family protein
MLDTTAMQANLTYMKKLVLPLVILTVFPVLASAHEFWLDPADYQVETGETIIADLKNGQNFEGVSLPFNTHSFERFTLLVDGTTTDTVGRLGDRPGLQNEAAQDGLHIYSYQSTISHVSYKVYEKFQTFADYKSFKDMRALHQARNLPDVNFQEAYTRYAKTLIDVGHGRGSDVQTGLEAELVALQNPYTDDLSDGLQVQAFYQETPQPDTQIELFEKAPDGTVTVTLHRTDGDGIATLPTKAGHSYLVDNVVLREPSADVAAQRGAVWETLWASLTFAVPE